MVNNNFSVMRQKDHTPIKCQLCSETVTASGMGSHLYHKHNNLSSDEYAFKFGEFRKSKLKLLEKKVNSDVSCKVCSKKVVSHKGLLHHITIEHSMNWKDYYIKYFFGGKHPTCQCGCGKKVKLLKNGKNDKKEKAYSREYLPGHNTKLNLPGYRFNTQEQKDKMRESAIKRMKQSKGTFFTNGPSSGEVELRNFIYSVTKKVEFNNKEILSGLEIDIYLPDYKIGIEYNGDYFHSDLFKKKSFHLKKTKELQDKGIRLIHIWESDWYCRKKIVKSMLLNILNKTPNRIYARNTLVKEISKKESNEFLNENHLQGSSVDKIRLGLYFNNELVSVMTFSSLRKAVGHSSKNGSYELVRFCNKVDTTVIGGASKLYRFFIKKYSPSYIVSFANRDWSNGSLYNKLGMKFEKFTTPGYFYSKSRHKFSRFRFQKHKLVEQGEDPTLTEYQIMLKNGFYRVWDTGNYKFYQVF